MRKRSHCKAAVAIGERGMSAGKKQIKADDYADLCLTAPSLARLSVSRDSPLTGCDDLRPPGPETFAAYCGPHLPREAPLPTCRTIKSVYPPLES